MWGLLGWRALGESKGRSELDHSQDTHLRGGLYREIPRRDVKPQSGYSPGTQEWKGDGCKMGVNPTWVPPEGLRLGAFDPVPAAVKAQMGRSKQGF